jgi:molecular chaperone IbpA
LFDDLDRRFQNASASTYPPYNITADNDEGSYTISLAVAGFTMDQLDITKDGNTLNIEGTAGVEEEDVNYLHKGIATRGFRRSFTLADHVEVEGATLELGLLNIQLKRHSPDEMKPRKIAISAPTVSLGE